MNRKYGALSSPTDFRDFRVASAATKIELPTEYTLRTTTIKDQRLSKLLCSTRFI